MPVRHTPSPDGRVWVRRLPLPTRNFTPRERRAIAVSIAALGVISLEVYGIGEPLSLTPAQVARVKPLFVHGLLQRCDPPAPAAPAPSQERVIVRLLRQVMPNNIGEVIGVPRDVADRYLATGTAELVSEALAAAPAPTEDRVRVRTRVAFDNYCAEEEVWLPRWRVAQLHGGLIEALDRDVVVPPAPPKPPPPIPLNADFYDPGPNPVIVEVVAPFGVWQRGDRAAFSPELAQRLCDEGRARALIAVSTARSEAI